MHMMGTTASPRASWDGCAGNPSTTPCGFVASQIELRYHQAQNTFGGNKVFEKYSLALRHKHFVQATFQFPKKKKNADSCDYLIDL